MDGVTSPPPGQTATHPLGVGEPLPLVDLPEPEEVFGVPHLGRKEVVKFVLGPSLIALGISIGSGEWLLGPLNVGTLGFVGVGWIITISALLQVFYNIEFSRYVLATGEVPSSASAGCRRESCCGSRSRCSRCSSPSSGAAEPSRPPRGCSPSSPARSPRPRTPRRSPCWPSCCCWWCWASPWSRARSPAGLELANLVSIGVQLVFLLVLDLFIVPFSVWWDALKGLVTPALPPEGSDATLLGGLAGFTALASGLNWYVMNHYRDKGYGMGSRIGYLSGLRGERQEVRAVGVTFPDDEKNAALWKRWMGFLKLDMWVVFFGGAMIGMFLPIILMRQMVLLTGDKPTQANVPTFVANALDQEYGRWLFYIALFIGFLILFDTQLGIFEALVRNMTDAVNTSPRLQQAISGDPRRFYYPFMIVLTAVIGLFLQFFQPATLVLISANMSNFGALVFPFLLIYMNSRLPRTARPRTWSYVILLLNFVFFGFFFLNFVFDQLTGEALVQF